MLILTLVLEYMCLSACLAPECQLRPQTTCLAVLFVTIYKGLWLKEGVNKLLLTDLKDLLHGSANTSIFHNNLRVMLSPLKSPVLRKYSNPFKRPGMYPSISKCNAKRCNCCMHLCTNSTVTSCVNGRKFSVVNNSDVDWKSIDLIYVLTWKTKNCNMQYVGKTCRALQKRFGEHYRRMKKPKPIDTFLYQHFKFTGHSPNDVLVQPVEKLYSTCSPSIYRFWNKSQTAFHKKIL